MHDMLYYGVLHWCRDIKIVTIFTFKMPPLMIRESPIRAHPCLEHLYVMDFLFDHNILIKLIILI